MNFVLIFGNFLKLYSKKLKTLFIQFLRQRGFEIKYASRLRVKCFNCSTSLNFLGFTFKFPNSYFVCFDKGKFTFEYDAMCIVSKTFSNYCKIRPYLLVQSSSLKKLKTSLRVLFRKQNSYLSVKYMISKVNMILRSFLNYYNLTTTIKKQVLSINKLVFKLFYKYLLRKFSSVAQIYSFIKTHFIYQNRFKYKNHLLLKTKDIDPLGSVSLACLAPPKIFLTANIYVDCDIFVRKIKRQSFLKRIFKLSYCRYLLRQELVYLLYENQGGICLYCNREIDLNYEYFDVDQVPNIYALKYCIWFFFEDLILVNLNLPEFIRFVCLDVQYKLVHEVCNKVLCKGIKNVLGIKIREIIQNKSVEDLQKFQSFFTDSIMWIKKIRNLNQLKMDQILLQMGLLK